uniref:Uncharacterized protein n=1 Tax=Setaria italica TaxID=4555 RepID=K3XU71_SETIT
MIKLPFLLILSKILLIWGLLFNAAWFSFFEISAVGI